MTVKWSPFPAAARKQKFQLLIKSVMLEGLSWENIEIDRTNVVVIETKWIAPDKKSTGNFLPTIFQTKKGRSRSLSKEKQVMGGGKGIEWNDDEHSRLCRVLYIPQNDSSRNDVSFTILYGQSGNGRKKLIVLGKTWLNLGELAEEEVQVVRKLPITLHIANVAVEATLKVFVSHMEVRNSNQLPVPVKNSAESSKADGLSRWVGRYSNKMSWKKKKNKKNSQDGEASCVDSPVSGGFDSLGSLEDRLSIGNELESSPGSEETQLYLAAHAGFLKRKRSSFKSETTEIQPLVMKTKGMSNEEEHECNTCIDSVTSCHTQNPDEVEPPLSNNPDEECTKIVWESKELVSRDGHAKLKANVCFASLDQRSEKAAGASACTAIVAVIAHWLQSNQGSMPTMSKFESLITEGSSEWQKLCGNESYLNWFPDKHFDLETVLKAYIRSIILVPGKSFTGFFSPEKFNCLKEAMSFDEIWEEISSEGKESETRIYIVGWNDHFFVLKVEKDAYYIIDSLGERLYEGCNQAYILKFDESATMCKTRTKEDASNGQEENIEQLICNGRDCCKEFLKQFLAAIPLKELEMEEDKGTVSNISLHQRLQIEFHYTCSVFSIQ